MSGRRACDARADGSCYRGVWVLGDVQQQEPPDVGLPRAPRTLRCSMMRHHPQWPVRIDPRMASISEMTAAGVPGNVAASMMRLPMARRRQPLGQGSQWCHGPDPRPTLGRAALDPDGPERCPRGPSCGTGPGRSRQNRCCRAQSAGP